MQFIHVLMETCKKDTLKQKKNHARHYYLRKRLALTVIGLIEDFSALIGSIRDGWTEVTDLEGTGHLMDNGERLSDLLEGEQAEGWR